MGSIGIVSRNLIKKHWAYNPQNSRIHIRNPNKGQGFLNQVPTFEWFLDRFLTGFFQDFFECSSSVSYLGFRV